MSGRVGTHLALVGVVAIATACSSPFDDDAIDALGPEQPGVPEGEFHRPGQPCLVCHGGYGPGEPNFSFGGTVFGTPNDKVGVEGARVVLTDSLGESREVRTNCIGNFYIEQDDWMPAFPVHAEVICPLPGTMPVETTRAIMTTRINRDGSCAGCHEGESSLDSPGWVYCSTVQPSPPYLPEPECPGSIE